MFCKKCGNEIKDGVKFCSKCGMSQDVSTMNSTSSTEKKFAFQSVESLMLKKNKKSYLLFIVIIIIIMFFATGNLFDKSSNKNTNEEEIVTELSKYQKTNSYGIVCNGNNDLAIEAANVFANKYGDSGHDWTLKSVDASVSGMSGTYRYSYTWAGNSYTATTNFQITDYGSYRNYTWNGDFADLFYGN